MICGYDLSTYGIMIAVLSFGGFVVENIWLAVTKGYMNSRNMHAPFLLGYGLLILAFYFLFGTPDHVKVLGMPIEIENGHLRYFVYFLIAMVTVSISEIVLGTFVEKCCGIVWWDYRNIPLHFTKYTSLPTSLGFAFIIVEIMENLFLPIMQAISMLHKTVAAVLAIGVDLIMIVDFLVSMAHMFISGKLHSFWHITINPEKEKRCLEAKIKSAV